MTDEDSFMARRLGQLIAEKMIEPHRQIAFDVREEMRAKMDANVRDCIGQSHIAFGAACAYEAYQQLAEHNAAFDSQWRATMRGIDKWREAHPGNELVMPDHADFVTWLIERAFPVKAIA